MKIAQLSEARIRKQGGESPAAHVATMAGIDDAGTEILGSNQFLRQLTVEKRRADRTKSPLSLVVVQVDTGRDGLFDLIDELLDELTRSKREIDSVGYIGGHRIGLILPHTGEDGLEAFLKILARRMDQLPVSIHGVTYPDDLFDNLSADASDFSDTIAFFFDEDPQLGRVAAFSKRFMDIVGALVGIIVFSPIMLLTAIAIATTSTGAIIFRQTRLGKGAVPFVFLKFRSMRVDSDDSIHRQYVSNLIDGKLDSVNEGDESRPHYKMSRDPRVTRVGRIIRSTSIDELPQFFNVLRGDMSLVGPRPPLPYEVEKYQSWHLRRVLQIRPGITGLWQVEGRSKTSFDDMVRLDLRYIRHWSIWLDVKILLRTILVVLRRDGAG